MGQEKTAARKIPAGFFGRRRMAAAVPYFRDADVSALALGEVAREGRVYVAPLEPALSVQTPPLALATGVDGPFAGLAVSGAFAEFAERAEAALLEACLAAKSAWLRRDAPDDALRASFRSFLADGVLRVKADGVQVFDADGLVTAAEEAPAGARVRAVLDLARVCFGRAEFGGIWRLRQVQLVPDAALQLTPEPAGPDPDAAGPAEPEDDLAEGVDEFL